MSTMMMMPLKRWASAPARAEPVPEVPCGICLESVELADLVSLCGGACETRMCGGCVAAYLHDRAGGGAPYCPRVECPGCRAFVPAAKWAAVARDETVKAYEKSAHDMLTLQCVRCDQRKTLLPAFGEKEDDRRKGAPAEAVATLAGQCAEALARHAAGDRGAAAEVVDAVLEMAAQGSLVKDLRAEEERLKAELAAGELEWRKWMGAKGGEIRAANEVYRAARKRLGRAKEARKADEESKEAALEFEQAREEVAGARDKVNTMRQAKREEMGTQAKKQRLAEVVREIGKVDEALALMLGLLRTVEDTERRATLMMQFLRKHPAVRSRCHDHPHCFNCKTNNLHAGRSCEENQRRNLPQDIGFCPGCCMPLLKGDGCSSVKCVCGRQFSWHEAVKAGQ